jgi:hypothetical protein
MKQIFTIILICLNYNLIFAQVEVTGQVKDAQTKNALEFCSVAAVTPKDSLIKNCVTDNNGFFSISLNGGYYRFIISFMGYKGDTTAVIPVMENKFIGVFKMNADEKYLKAVSVTAKASENRIDRDEQVVTDKMREGASDTKDVLDKVNGVEYDRYSNSIKVDNDSKVLILVDGMEKDQEYIKNLAPERLKKVEVIRSPGGRYALEGYSAVINIILKKDYQGTEVFLSDRSIMKPDATKPQYIPLQNDASATVNYVYNKLNVYAKYSFNNNNFNLSTSDDKVYSNGSYYNEFPAAGNSINTNVKQLYSDYTLGADYFINPKHTISFESNLTTSPWSGNLTEQFYNVNSSIMGDVQPDASTQTTDQSKNYSTYNSLFYEGKLDENNVINSNFTYSTYHDNFNEIFTTDNASKDMDQIGNDSKNGTKFYVEYTHTFGNKTNLQLGYGNTWEQRNNNFSADTISSNFKFNDLRHKFYAYYSWDKNNKFSFKIGAASETSAQSYLTTPPGGNYTKNNYLIFQPYADIKYTFSKIFDMKLKYRAGSTYPNIGQTNPFITVNDINTVSIGNPNLHPSILNKVSMQMDVLGGFLTVEPYYHYSNNYITQSGELINPIIFENTYSNAGNYRHYGVDSRLAFPIGKQLIFLTDCNFFKSSIDYRDTTSTINDWTMSSKLIYRGGKSHTVAGIIYQRDMYKNITAQGYNRDYNNTDDNSNDYWIAFIQQPFFKQRLNVMLVYFLPINWQVDYNQSSFIKVPGYSETKNNDISFLKNMVLLQLSYRFNKGKTVTAKEKNIEKENERNTQKIM